jgi:hypothetical protein
MLPQNLAAFVHQDDIAGNVKAEVNKEESKPA